MFFIVHDPSHFLSGRFVSMLQNSFSRFRKPCRLILIILSLMFFTSGINNPLIAQNPEVSIRQLVDTIASPFMGGRGYVDSGLPRAAQYIEDYFRQKGLKTVAGNYRQPFTHSVNIFNGDMSVSINGIKLVPGRDFLVTPGSKSVEKSGSLQVLDSVRLIDPKNRVVFEKVPKLTWAVSTVQDDYTVFQLVATAWPSLFTNYKASVNAKFLKNYTSENIVGLIPGTEKPDSFLVLTAHFDHLGKMGSGENAPVFRGANDNASGVAMLLKLAETLAKKPMRYSVLFIAFAGEEAGLLGSDYFVKHPMVPLKNIRFLVNMDLLGTGEEGLMVVNATEYPAAFQILDSLNKQSGALSKIGQRGKAANSDHYWFSENGVPAFFVYTMGGIKAYHDIYDLPETLPLTKTIAVGQLIIRFFGQLSNSAAPELD